MALFMKLILFDLDKTLFDVFAIQTEAFQTVFERKYKVKTALTEVEYAGVPYKEIVKNLIVLKTERIAKHAEYAVRRAERKYERILGYVA